MTTVALSAHFDGKAIQLDEPYRLRDDAKLVVVVLPDDAEKDSWTRLSAAGLNRAYGDNEPEYSVADLNGRP